MASSHKIITFCLLLFLASSQLDVSDAGMMMGGGRRGNAGLSVLLAAGLLSILLGGNGGGQGGGGLGLGSLRSALGAGRQANPPAAPTYRNNAALLHSLQSPQYLESLRHSYSIGDFNPSHIYGGLGGSLDLHSLNSLRQLQTLARLQKAAELRSLSQLDNFGIDLSSFDFSGLGFDEKSNENLGNSERTQTNKFSGNGQIVNKQENKKDDKEDSDVSSRYHAYRKSILSAGEYDNPSGGLGYNESPLMSMPTLPVGPLSGFKNSYGYSSNHRDLSSGSEKENDDSDSPNYSSSYEYNHQQNERAAANPPCRNRGHKSRDAK